MTYTLVGNEYVIDERGNRATLERWGTEEAARKSLEALTDCSYCSDCSDCSYCSDCSGCSYCSGCSGCSRCSRCSGCSGCLDCSYKQGKKVGNGPPPIPVIEDIHRKVYEAAIQEGNSLSMGRWHTCGTTHCRGGWVVHLAGEAGYALEKRSSPLFAAQQIYKASGFLINPCRFFDSNADALADMRRLAGVSP